MGLAAKEACHRIGRGTNNASHIAACVSVSQAYFFEIAHLTKASHEHCRNNVKNSGILFCPKAIIDKEDVDDQKSSLNNAPCR